MAYQVQITPRAARQLISLPAEIRQALQATIDGLQENPHPSGSIKLQGTQSQYRVRRGDYRMVYEVGNNPPVVTVLTARHRRDVYRRG